MTIRGVLSVDVVYSKQAVKNLGRRDKAKDTAGHWRNTGDIKPLQGYSDCRQRLRIGKYRIVFNYVTVDDEPAVYIMDIESRGAIYK